jgi:SAM-dependent methyltransferase
MTTATRPAERLSRSELWQLQSEWFERHGIRAWNDAIVPSQLTSSSAMARAYASLVLGWLRDLTSADVQPPLDPAQPVNIVELGCGNGRFAYRFVCELLDLLDAARLPDLRFRYICTDFTDATLAVLRANEVLRPLVERGVVDFARFDLRHDRELHLTASGEVLARGAVTNPIVVIANYVFDGVPQDCFRIEHGKISEILVALRSSEGDEEEHFQGLRLAFEEHPLEGPAYDDPEWNRILESYGRHLIDTNLLFPTAALELLGTMRELSGGRMLLLSSDKGDIREESLDEQEVPDMSVHGSVSFMVNYHAIREWFRAAGGTFLQSPYEGRFCTVAALLGAPETAWREMRLGWREAIERGAPYDLYCLTEAVRPHFDSFNFEQLVASIRLSGCDPHALLLCFPALLAAARNVNEDEREVLLSLLQQVWERAFPLREPSDLPGHLGVLRMAVDDYRGALAMFRQSMAIYGPHPGTYRNMARCHEMLQEPDEAQQCAAEALLLETTP